jgi:hypothetical protein
MMNRLFLSVLLLVGFMACDDDNDDKNKTAEKVQQIKNDVMKGQWRVTYFYDTDHDETSVFNGYAFTFNNAGTLTATNGVTTNTGTWSVTDSDNSNDDDDALEDIDFNIAFPSPAEFTEISDDWDVISQTSTKIELRDESGGNGGTDYLTFEKL